MKLNIKEIALFLCLTTFSALAQSSVTTEQLIKQIYLVNEYQNKVLMKGSTIADADALFNMYSHDFIYVHEQYGGEYTKQHLYNNTIKYLKGGQYNYSTDRYTIVNIIPGRKSVAVQRLQLARQPDEKAEYHLAVFEFEGLKIKRITEYW